MVDCDYVQDREEHNTAGCRTATHLSIDMYEEHKNRIRKHKNVK